MTYVQLSIEDAGPLVDGLVTSLFLAGASLAIGLPMGLMLAILCAGRARSLRFIALSVIELGRAFPAIVILQIAYYGLPSIDITLSSFAAGVAALAWITGAYSSVIFKAGIDAVPRGHTEAALSMSVSSADLYRFILIPQGFRIALPALLGLAIQIFQATALAFTIAVPEILQEAYQVGSRTFEFLPILLAAGALYVVVVLPAGYIVRRLELRLGRHLPDAQR